MPTPRPPDASTDLEALVTQDMVRRFRSHAAKDAGLVLTGNLLVLVTFVALFSDAVPMPVLAVYAGTVFVTTLYRAAMHLRGARPAVSDRSYLAGVRANALLHGLSWGLGAAWVLRWLQGDDLAILIGGFAGILGASLHTLSADARAYPRLVLGVAAPLPVGLLLVATREHHPVLAGLIVLFIIIMLLVHRRNFHGIADHLRTMALLSRSEQAQVALVADLQAALGTVKTLTGLLPICANCRKVRDDGGYWSNVEHYVSEHTDARFSHGICPTCFPKLYPGIPFPEPDPTPV